MLLKFLKYFFWGILGLVIQTHGWNFYGDFFVLTLAFAFPILGLGSTLILGLTLSFFYGAHSLSPWAAWWLPAGFCLVLLRFYKSFFVWPRWLQCSALILLLLVGQWFWAAAWGGGVVGVLWGLTKNSAATLVIGLGVIPLLQRCGRFFAERLPRPRARMGELPIYWRNMKPPPTFRGRRRPFGLERV